MYSAEFCNSEVSSFKSDINEIIRKVNRHFSEMDFENANVRTEMEIIVENIVKQLEYARSELEGITFL